MAAQNKNYVKRKIDNNPLEKRKCRLSGYRDERVNHIISECNKLVEKEYKGRHDWVGKEIYWESYKN